MAQKVFTCNAGDLGSIPGSGRSPGGGHGNPLQRSCLENPMDRGARWARAHRVRKSWTWLSGSAQHSAPQNACLLSLFASLSPSHTFLTWFCLKSTTQKYPQTLPGKPEYVTVLPSRPARKRKPGHQHPLQHCLTPEELTCLTWLTLHVTWLPPENKRSPRHYMMVHFCDQFEQFQNQGLW